MTAGASGFRFPISGSSLFAVFHPGREYALALVVLCSGCFDGSPTSEPESLIAVPRYSNGGIGGTMQVAGNGPGACMLEDTQNAGFINNSADLNCGSNDISIASARVTSYSLNGGPFTALAAGQPISCNPGDIIRAVTVAALSQNAASPRLDVGIWINELPGGDALRGSSPQCVQYTLRADAEGAINIDSDQCGDLVSGINVLVPLDTLFATCPGPGTASIHIGSCVAWSQPGADRECPANPPGGEPGFRLGSTPGSKSKCNCGGFDIPITTANVTTLQSNPIGYMVADKSQLR